jgi:hypothetical protein
MELLPRKAYSSILWLLRNADRELGCLYSYNVANRIRSMVCIDLRRTRIVYMHKERGLALGALAPHRADWLDQCT